MIMHCTKCDHEWQVVEHDPCFACGVIAHPETNTLHHTPLCTVMVCCWCGARGEKIASDYLDIEVDLDGFKEALCEFLVEMGAKEVDLGDS